MLRAIIFDVDGTLAETEELHRAAFNAVFQDLGLDIAWDQPTYAQLLRVTGGRERVRYWCDLAGLNWSEAYIADLHRLKTERYAAMLAGGAVALRAGITRLIHYARHNGLRMGVATATSAKNVETLSQSCFGRPAQEVFDAIAAGDHVVRKKPAPDVYLLALSQLGVAARDAIAIEDSANGIASARTAGLRVIVSPSLYSQHDDLSAASQIYASFDDVPLPLV